MYGKFSRTRIELFAFGAFVMQAHKHPFYYFSSFFDKFIQS